MSDEIMREGTLLGNLAHEHGDRAAYRLIHINDEHLVVISDKHRAPTARRQNCAHLHLDHRLVHQVNATRADMKNKRCNSGVSLWLAESENRRDACPTFGSPAFFSKQA